MRLPTSRRRRIRYSGLSAAMIPVAFLANGLIWRGMGAGASIRLGHHLVFWTKGGPTTLPNLALVCQPHRRKLHEEGWTLERRKDGRFLTVPPSRRVMPSARSA